MDQRIKVVFGVNDFLVGGMQRQFIEQMRFFDRSRFDISLITLFEFPSEPDLYDQLPEDLSVYRMHFKNVRDVAAWKELYSLMKRLQPDIVVSSLFFANAVFRLMKPFVGYAAIPCEHNTYVNKSRLHKFVDRMLAFVSYRIVAVSSTVASFTALQEGIKKDKFIVIPNGIDVSLWQKEIEELPSKEALMQELGFVSGEIVVLTVARLMPQKNQRLLLESFAQFNCVYPNSVLAIVGHGPLREALESYAKRLNIHKKVIFFGMRRDVIRFYKASNLFVLTSDIEGFALVCIEAMAAGLPVVSTVTAGPDEYIKDGINGFLTRDRSASSVATGMQMVLSSDARLLREGALKTAEYYTTSRSTALYERLFEEAARHNRI